MFCEKCGNRLEGNEQFCKSCGAPVKKENNFDWTSSNKKIKFKKNETILLVSILTLLLVAAGALLIAFFRNGTSKEKRDIAVKETQEITETQKEFIESEIKEEAVNIVKETQTATEDDGIRRYEFCQEDVSWTEAMEKCRAKGGKLLTLDTEQEYGYILNQIKEMGYQDKLFWLGGRRGDNATEYYWLDQSGNTYGDILNAGANSAKWMKGEPSYRDKELAIDEKYMNFYFYKSENNWVWNDVPDDIIKIVKAYKGRVVYICEFEE